MQTSLYHLSKPRYEILDGLRGVAALLVVLFHLLETYSGGPATQIINHGYLAVDFFFALSCFVIGYAYDDRRDNMSALSFFKRRLGIPYRIVSSRCICNSDNKRTFRKRKL